MPLRGRTRNRVRTCFGIFKRLLIDFCRVLRAVARYQFCQTEQMAVYCYVWCSRGVLKAGARQCVDTHGAQTQLKYLNTFSFISIMLFFFFFHLPSTFLNRRKKPK